MKVNLFVFIIALGLFFMIGRTIWSIGDEIRPVTLIGPILDSYKVLQFEKGFNREK